MAVKSEDEEETIHTKETSGGTPTLSPSVENDLDSLRGGGQPLSPSVRAFFEPRFGYDFSGVQVHTNGRAAETAQRVNARAFTVGLNVVLGSGEYTPGTIEGKKLLAHELTHVVQQSPAHSRMGAVIQRQPNRRGPASRE